MIAEYAIDPACVKQPADLLRLLAGMGCEHGRVVVDYSLGGWAKELLATATRRNVPSMDRKRLARRLDLIRHSVLRSNRRYDDTEAWLTNASNCVPRFHAVVSPETTGCPEHISLGSDLEENPRWNVAREKVIPRRACDLAATLGPFVHPAREAIFVDPHFAPEAPRWRKALAALLAVAHRGTPLVRCEFHLRGKTEDSYFRNALEQQVGPEMPNGSFVVFIRWKPRPGGESLHPRYVLTEFGGVRVEHGLDEGKPGEVTDVGILDQSTWRRRRADYSFGASTFEPAGQSFRVSRAVGGSVVVEAVT